MTVAELYNRLHYEIKRGHGDYDVKIITDNTSIGARASTNLKHVGIGIDWEHSQLNLIAEDRIMKVEDNYIEFSLKENTSQLGLLRNPKNPE